MRHRPRCRQPRFRCLGIKLHTSSPRNAAQHCSPEPLALGTACRDPGRIRPNADAGSIQARQVEGTGRVEDETAAIQGIRWSVLLALQIAAFLVQPLVGPSVLSEICSLILFEIVVVTAVLSTAANWTIRVIGGITAVVWFLATIGLILGAPVHMWVTVLTPILLIGALAVTFRHLVDSAQSNLNTLLGAIFGYLLVAMSWAVVNVQIERWQPGSFSLPEGGNLWTTMLYYSLVTLTTVGYGDILPVSDLARMSAGFEATIGVLYIAVMVGSIVGSFQRTKHR
jgi:hypothetical protein